MRKTERIVVDGTTFEVTQLKLDDGLEVYNSLAKILGSSAAATLASSGGELTEATVVGFIVSSVGAMPLELMKRLSVLFAAQTKIITLNGGNELPVAFKGEFYEDEFAGRLGHWTNWIVACLKLNFADFLPKGLSEKLSPKAADGPTETIGT